MLIIVRSFILAFGNVFSVLFKGIKSLEQNIDHMSVNLDLAVANFGEYVLHVMGQILHPLVTHCSGHTFQ